MADDVRPAMQVYHATDPDGVEYWVVACDEAIALEALLEYEVDPSTEFQFQRLEPESMLAVRLDSEDDGPIPRDHMLDRPLGDDDTVRVTATVAAWAALHDAPMVLGCTEW